MDNIEDEDLRNSMIMVLLAIRAYSLENDEPFSVDSSIITDVIKNNDENDLFVPVLQVTNDEEGRTNIEVEFRELTDEEVLQYNEEYEDDEQNDV